MKSPSGAGMNGNVTEKGKDHAEDKRLAVRHDAQVTVVVREERVCNMTEVGRV